MRTTRPGVVRSCGVAAVVAFTIVWQPSAAAAHGVGTTLPPTNYVVEISAIAPSVPGVEARTAQLGRIIELTNRSSTPVVVLGYDDEPYLKVDRDGVYENSWSPAVRLNRSFTPSNSATPTSNQAIDPRQPPNWRKVGTGPTARWHDHRAHWMSPTPPPMVTDESGHRSRLVFHWTIPMRYGGAETSTPVELNGTIRYVPPAHPWVWPVVATLLAVVGVFASRARTHRALRGLLGALFAVSAIHAVGEWGYAGTAVNATLGAAAYASVGALLALIGLTAPRARRDPAPWLLLSSLVVFLGVGLIDVETWFRSQLPTRVPGDVARVVAAAAVGFGVAGIVAAARLLNAPVATEADTDLGADQGVSGTIP